MRSRFLLIDDDEDDRILFCDALNDIDPEIPCDTEGNGRLAIKKLESGELARPDIIFLDVNLPVVNGWDVLRKLKQHDEYQSIPVIMYSTSGHESDIEKAHRYGALSYVRKPFDFRELRETLRTIVDSLPVLR
jgi:CheY-like chemotaxis protein